VTGRQARKLNLPGAVDLPEAVLGVVIAERRVAALFEAVGYLAAVFAVGEPVGEAASLWIPVTVLRAISVALSSTLASVKATGGIGAPFASLSLLRASITSASSAFSGAYLPFASRMCAFGSKP
jgi:hypothetical protein